MNDKDLSNLKSTMSNEVDLIRSEGTRIKNPKFIMDRRNRNRRKQKDRRSK
jgi:hypothetical protein